MSQILPARRYKPGQFMLFILFFAASQIFSICGQADDSISIVVPEGFSVERVAASPLVQHPMLGCFDDRGRLFLAESAGRNLNEVQLDELRPNSIRMLEDLDGDGVFDRATVFADQLAIPNGALWLDGSLYIAEPPGIWKLTDIDDDGVADVRELVAGKVRSNGMSSTLHGPTLHPSGRLFWCGGQLGYTLEPAKKLPAGRIAPGIFSLLPDGSEHEIYAVGGIANPVEVAFGASGDIFGTLAILDFPDGARHDALMHWVYGGLYASRDNIPDSVNRTGPALPPLSHVGQVAPAGLARYQGTTMRTAGQEVLFWAQFNTHSVIRTTLTREGASYRANDEDFAVSESVDFHPTDVIEDADGSLLIIDTGGWFRHGCPTSRIARPEALGAIYRVRHNGAPQIDDPRGKHIAWQSASPSMLIPLLDDPRPAVVERAIAALVQLGDQGVSLLGDALVNSSSKRIRLNSVWSLSRLRTADSLDAIVIGLADREPDVRQAAASALGFERHPKAVNSLLNVVQDDDDLLARREAASALGRIAQVESVTPLLEALDSSSDPFFQHAVIDALIRIGQTDPLVTALSSESKAIRRGGLLALRELGETDLAEGTLRPMLEDHDIPLREAAFEIVAGEERLQPVLAQVIPTLLSNHEIIHASRQRESIRDTLLQIDNLPIVQQALATAFPNPATGHEARMVILEVMRLSSQQSFPQVWIPLVKSALTGENIPLRELALSVATARPLPEFQTLLIAAVNNDQLPMPFRIHCLEAIAPRLKPTPDSLFQLAMLQLEAGQDSLVRVSAARALSLMELSGEQLTSVTEQITASDALVLPALLNCFSRSTDTATGNQLLRAIERRDTLQALPPEQLSGVIRRFPAEVQAKAGPLLDRMGVNLAEQERRMAEWMLLSEGGDVLRGKEIFFGKKASCSACHRVKGQGELVGPNLSTIATIRTPRDLMESIIFPSSSIVQDYRPVVVLTQNQIVTGLEIRRNDQELWLKRSDLSEMRIRIEDIEDIREASTSMMPQGLEQKLSPDELRDLLAFLLDLKPSPSYLLDE